tara:strand:- start:370 stop:1086 length:717 start_codon:yes stop_codon:yes gene_type:complete
MRSPLLSHLACLTGLVAIGSPASAMHPESLVTGATAMAVMSPQQTIPVRREVTTIVELSEDDFVPPEPVGNPGDWIMTSDYPASANANGEEGTVSVKLSISATGDVTACEVVAGTASDSLKQLTCTLLSERAKFNPARGPDGKAVSGFYNSAVLWKIPESGGGLQPAPRDENWDYSFVLETDGSVSKCVIKDAPESSVMNECQAGDQSVFFPIRDENGEPVRREVRVKISVEVVEVDE